MRERALVIAATPEAFDGPWVSLEDGVWSVEAAGDYKGMVRISAEDASGSILDIPLDGEPVLLEGFLRARVVICDGIVSIPVERITVTAREN
jgi:hypothetical protein